MPNKLHMTGARMQPSLWRDMKQENNGQKSSTCVCMLRSKGPTLFTNEMHLREQKYFYRRKLARKTIGFERCEI